MMPAPMSDTMPAPTPSPSTKWKTAYDFNRRYNKNWEKEHPWLRKATDGSEQGNCTVCHCIILNKLSNILTHEKSFKHIRKAAASGSTFNVKESPRQGKAKAETSQVGRPTSLSSRGRKMSLTDYIGERLREAACADDLSLMVKLEAQGVDFNSKNGINGWTALHCACKRNHITSVKYLLEKGASKNIRNKYGIVPVQLTTSEEIRELLGDYEVTNVPTSCLDNTSSPHGNSDNEEHSYDYLPCNNTNYKASGSDELVLKVRIADNDEKDFIEIELPQAQINFSGLLEMMSAELGVDKNIVVKIRKLPDTIIRNDKDVERLRDYQEVELVLTEKSMGNS